MAALRVLVVGLQAAPAPSATDREMLDRLDSLDASLVDIRRAVAPAPRPLPRGALLGTLVALALIILGAVLVLRSNTERNRAEREAEFAVAEVQFFQSAVTSSDEAVSDKTQLLATMLTYKEVLDADDQEKVADLIELVSGGEEDIEREVRDLDRRMAQKARDDEVATREHLNGAIMRQERSQYVAAVMIGVGSALLGSMISEAYGYVSAIRWRKAVPPSRHGAPN